MEPVTNLIPLPPQTLIKPSKVLAIRQSESSASDYVTHLTPDQVKRLAEAAETTRMGKRDSLLIKLLFDTAMRVSEALTVRPCDLEEDPQGWHIRVKGKGNRVGVCAVSSQLVMQLQSFAYSSKIDPSSQFFPFNRSRAFQIISKAYKLAGLLQPSKERDRVGCVHVLRHSGCIERLKQTGNPRAVQDQLRHKSSQMTLRYMRTLSAKESLAINEDVKFNW
jgi:integrase